MDSRVQRERSLTATEADTEALDSGDDPWLGNTDARTAEQNGADRALPAAMQTGGNGSASRDVPRPVKYQQAFSGGSLVGDPEALRRQWESVQVGFVDDPRGAVDEAERLVSMVVEELVERFRRQRQELERSWSQSSDESSLNDLRQAFQHYRDFFARLLQI